MAKVTEVWRAAAMDGTQPTWKCEHRHRTREAAERCVRIAQRSGWIELPSGEYVLPFRSATPAVLLERDEIDLEWDRFFRAAREA
jgi:hypothetical protein